MVSIITLVVCCVISACLGALSGLLVGRKNPKVADSAAAQAQKALDAVNKK